MTVSAFSTSEGHRGVEFSLVSSASRRLDLLVARYWKSVGEVCVWESIVEVPVKKVGRPCSSYSFVITKKRDGGMRYRKGNKGNHK